MIFYIWGEVMDKDVIERDAHGGPWTDFEISIMVAARAAAGIFGDAPTRSLEIKKWLKPYEPEAFVYLDGFDVQSMGANLLSAVCIALLREAPPHVSRHLETQWRAYLETLQMPLKHNAIPPCPQA